MKFVFYTNSVSPHQLPLARELVCRLGEDEYRYVYTTCLGKERRGLGWGTAEADWLKWSGNEEVKKWLEDCQVLYTTLRDIDLFERRARDHKQTFYTSERWFKPLGIFRRFGSFDFLIPGWGRMLSPKYFRMARRFVGWLNSDVKARYLAIGPWAAKDMQWLGVKLDKIVSWGYYVEPSRLSGHALPAEKPQGVVRLLWVGRLLGLKRVDDIVRAVRAHDRLKRVDDFLPKITLDIYGSGAEELRLRWMVTKYGLNDLIKFHPPVPIAEVRKLMHEHDVYVLSSNAYEGWGAVVSEALEEGMKVIGTYEAGASATILPETNLYHAGDWRRLAELLRGDIPQIPIGQWTAKAAADLIMEMIE